MFTIVLTRRGLLTIVLTRRGLRSRCAEICSEVSSISELKTSPKTDLEKK